MRKINTVPPSNCFLELGRRQNSWISRMMFLLMTISVLVTGCDTQNGVDREAVKKEMANRELKRLRNSDILRRGEEIGKRYFAISDSITAIAFSDSLNLKSAKLKSGETDEERELLEAFVYAVENNQDLDDYLTDTTDLVFFYHPEVIGNNLEVTRLTISKKTIVKSL